MEVLQSAGSDVQVVKRSVRSGEYVAKRLDCGLRIFSFAHARVKFLKLRRKLLKLKL